MPVIEPVVAPVDAVPTAVDAGFGPVDTVAQDSLLARWGPDSPQMARPEPTCSRTAATDVSMIDVIVRRIARRERSHVRRIDRHLWRGFVTIRHR